MHPFRLLIPLVWVSLLPAAHSSSSANPTLECLTLMNAARTDVSFSALLVDQNEGPTILQNQQALQNQFCGSLREGKHPDALASSDTYTLAIHIQEGSAADCAAAVKYWQGGFSHFGQNLPPVYKPNHAPYDTIQSSSFVVLYAPREDTQLRCEYVTCQAPASFEVKTEPDQAQGVGVVADPTHAGINPGANALNATLLGAATAHSTRAQESGPFYDGVEGQSRRLAALEGEFHAVACGVTPKVFEIGSRPYTEEQWKRITNVLASSAVSSVPAVITFAALAFFISLL